MAGYWRKRDADAASELIRHKYRLSRVRDVLPRGDSVTVWKVTDVAEFLNLSIQRVDQLAQQGRLPAPTGQSGRARLRERSVIEAWAEAEWWDSRRWRTRRPTPRSSV